MDCKKILKLISGYLDGDINEEMQKELEMHLKECDKCCSFLHTMEKTIFFSRELNKRRKVPTKLLERVYCEIRIKYKR